MIHPGPTIIREVFIYFYNHRPEDWQMQGSSSAKTFRLIRAVYTI